MRDWVAGLGFLVCFGVVIGLVLWGKSKSPSPTPSSGPGPGSAPSNNYCKFKATGNNKDYFTISSSENIDLFPDNDNTKFTYPNNKGTILDCKINASGFTAYAPSGPTHLGYKIDDLNNYTNTTLLPADGKTTKNNNTCSWDPNSNICDIPICNLDGTYNVDILYKEKGVKQLLTEAELNSFKERVSCKNGEKVGKCSPAPSSIEGNCDIEGKQNNKINCLGTCSLTGNLTKDDCDTANGTWTYNPAETKCQYEILNEPKYNANIPQEGGKYKMCDQPGDNVPLDNYFTSCSGNCYPNPIAENPDNIHEMPLSWTNHCMFTNDDLTKPFTTSSTNDTDCSTSYFTGKVYHNICNGTEDDCYGSNGIQSKIESIIHSPSPSPIPPPCMGGGDTFDTYNSCEPVSCDNHFSGNPSKGYEYTSCGTGKLEKDTGSSSSPSPSISLPPASYCNPYPTSPSPGIANYMKSKVHSDCCEDRKCEIESCPSDLYNPIKDADNHLVEIKCQGSVCNISECCVLKTCSEYMDDNDSENSENKKTCNTDYTRESKYKDFYILPTCCNGMLQVTVTFNAEYNIKSIFNGIPKLNNQNQLTNVYPSLILKTLLKNPGNYDIDTINTTLLKNNSTPLSFINNLTTFIVLPKPDIVYMDSLENMEEKTQRGILSNNKENPVDFYILINQHDNTENITRFNIQKAWDDINKIIQGNTYDTTIIDKIDVVINDCSHDSNGACEVAPDDNRILGSPNSHCCVKNTCDTLSPETQTVIKKSCGTDDKHFEPEKVLSSPSPVSIGEATGECCVQNDITAIIPPLPSGMPQTVDAVYGSYVTKIGNSNTLNLNASIKFTWQVAPGATEGHWEAEGNANEDLQNNYACRKPVPVPTGNPARKPVFSVDPENTTFYKLEGCEDTKNIFCRIPDSDTQANSEREARIDIPITDERYDSKIYNLTKTLEATTGSYISMYKTLEIENEKWPSLNPNYGGITCQQDQAGIASIEPCDEPYGYIKFSGCNTYLNESDYQFYNTEYIQKDCIYFNASQCSENQTICEYDIPTKKCKPRPFPISLGDDIGKSCSANLEASDTFTDASWLKEGFTNYDYKRNIGNIGNIGNKGYSSRIINDDSSPSPSTREVSRRTNLCGYNFQSPTPTPSSNQPSSPPSKQIQPDSMNYYHSRVLDSTWLCEDKLCSASKPVNIPMPPGGDNITEFTSFFDGDPLAYEWVPNNPGSDSGSWRGKHFYSESILNHTGSELRFGDYRALQAGINDGKEESDSMTEGVKGRIDDFTGIQNRYSHLISQPSPSSSQGSQQTDDYNDSSYKSDEMKYVHNNIKYHNNYATMCGDNKYLRFFDYDTMSEITSKDQEASQMSLIKNYQKCTPCRYQRDQLTGEGTDKKYSEFYNGEYGKLSSNEKKYINDHNFPKSDGSGLGHVFLSEAIQNKDYNIHNYTDLSVDTRDMTNCSVPPVSPATSSNKEINIDEYSTHFVPWWRDTAATDLKVNNLATVSGLSSPKTIPTCDLHKDRCEGKTHTQCLNASSSLAWDRSATTVNASMCEWSDDAGGKCITNASWVNDQGVCGHPCLSRMDARPRECKFSDDCEIRDRYNFNIIEGNTNGLKMYCDSDGRNPILYGNKSQPSSLYEGDSIPISNGGKICKPGYILYDIGISETNSGNTPSSSQTPSPNSNTVYKCLKCDEINSYKDQGVSSLNASDTNFLQAYDYYVMNNKLSVADDLNQARIKQYQLKGNWKEINGACVKKPTCTSVLWPSPATAISAKYNPHSVPQWVEKVDTEVIYTQNPAVAGQMVKQGNYKQYYADCLNNTGIGNAMFNINEEGIWSGIWDNLYCQKSFAHMDSLLGLRTSLKNQTLTQQGLMLNCDSCPSGPSGLSGSPPCMQIWKYKDSSPIEINVGGMIPHSDEKSYDFKKTAPATRMSDMCPNYTNNGSYWDGNDPKRYYCSPIVGKGQVCYGTSDICGPHGPDGGCLTDNKCHGDKSRGDPCSDEYDCAMGSDVDGQEYYTVLPTCDRSWIKFGLGSKTCGIP